MYISSFVEGLNKPTGNKRRTNVQLDADVMRELENFVREYGFGQVNITTLTKKAYAVTSPAYGKTDE